MSFVPLPKPPEAAPSWPGRPLWTLLAWLVIVGVIVFQLVKLSQVPTDKIESMQDAAFEMQGRYLVGVSQMPGVTGGQLLKQIAPLRRGPYAQRLRVVVLVGEFGGPKEALKELDQLNGDGTADERADAERLRRHYRGEGLSDEENDRLRRDLGWFGELAVGDAETARRGAVRTALVFVGALGVLGTMFLVGLFLLVLIVLKGYELARSGRLGGMTVGRSPDGVYAETFAVWMLLYLGLGYGLSWLPLGDSRMLAGYSAGMLISLSCLLWPRLRGVPWLRIRGDLGLGLGRRPGIEILNGVGFYAVAIPLAATGALLMVLLRMAVTKLFGPSDPSHPAAEMVIRGDWWLRVQVLIAAGLMAPLVEETMFRGVLYRHLREATGGWRRAWSVLLSLLGTSFVFAIIHPQGVTAVPVLMALAAAFTLAREWRQSLVPSMVAHGINNTLVTGMLLLAMG